MLSKPVSIPTIKFRTARLACRDENPPTVISGLAAAPPYRRQQRAQKILPVTDGPAAWGREQRGQPLTHC